ncbi:hypothetical protein ABT288_20910 [Streptomyces sp. NPDC001093]|uniref:hypothetical protein n=1 Tax=Streptomyces sp. NPDC001093 TaxID=3154376 RepID=UPI00332D7803
MSSRARARRSTPDRSGLDGPPPQALRGGLDAEATAHRVLDAASAVDHHEMWRC